MIRPSSGSSSSSDAGIRGWFKSHSSIVGTDRGFSFLRLSKDFRLRSDSGVDKLPFDNIERSSSSNDGTDSADVERVDKKLSSTKLSLPGEHCSGLSSPSSNRILSAGLLLRLFSTSSFFHSLTNSSIEIRRELAGLRRNRFGFGRGICVTARSAATAGGSALGSCIARSFLLSLACRVLVVGILCASVGCVRSDGVGTSIAGVGTRTGSVVVRAGDAGLRPLPPSLRGDKLLRTCLRPRLFSSNMAASLGGEPLYLKDLGTNISPVEYCANLFAQVGGAYLLTRSSRTGHATVTVEAMLPLVLVPETGRPGL